MDSDNMAPPCFARSARSVDERLLVDSRIADGPYSLQVGQRQYECSSMVDLYYRYSNYWYSYRSTVGLDPGLAVLPVLIPLQRECCHPATNGVWWRGLCHFKKDVHPT